ncbi:MAG: pilus assembly protein, partial [Methylococcales bacterium]
FSYYRKRHLAVRAGIGDAFDGVKNIRTGMFTINNRQNVTMLDFDVSDNVITFYDTLYHIKGNSVVESTNRQALAFAGDQFNRQGGGAPITNECQKNFALAVTDGFSDPIGPGVRNEDGGQGSPYEDNFSDTFADVAMKYYNTVLRSDMISNQVPTAVGCNAPEVDPQLDCNDNLHMNTYTAGLGALGQSIFGVTHNKVSDAYAHPPAWTNVSGVQDGRQIDDFYHGAVNGRGEMFNARSPQELRTTLTSTLQGIQAKVGVATAVTFNTATPGTNSVVYLAFFNSANWSGDLLSFDLDSLGNVDPSSTWSAANLLDNADPSPADRVILTHNGTTGVGFQWNNLSTTEKADLNLVPGENGQNGLNFIRGDRSNEGSGKFRVRGSVLGDIVHSSPVFVGKPNLTWPDTAPFPTTAPDRYLDFRATLIHAPRQEVIYFGSNDGILHGVKASDGEEILAYIPKNLFSTNSNEGLHYLADPRYQHRYYVDLSPTISDVYINRNGSYDWHTILIGGERAGGRGFFALDVTDPAQFSEANASDLVLWEFTDPDIGGKLGFTYSKPMIAMMENGRWAAIFGNGYNDTGTGQAKLFIVFIDGGLDGSWTDGSGNSNLDYIMLSIGVGSIITPNGLATPAVVDIDGNGAADRAYAGDLLGNLWAFNLSDASTRGSPNTKPAWGIAHNQGNLPKPLFVAKDSANNLQPITSKPAVAFNPDPPSGGNNDPNVLVFFGTGKYLEQSDLTTTLTQSFYGVYDKGTGDRNRSNLVQQTIRSGSFAESDGHLRTDLRLISDNTINYSNKYGWVIDLNLITGERVVVDPILRGPLVFFNTWIPDSSACSSGGKGFLMSVEQLNGGEPDSPVFNIDSDTKVNETDILKEGPKNHAPAGEIYVNGLPAQSNFLSNKQYTPGTGTKVIETRDVADFGGSTKGRLSWQQLNR